MNRKLFFIGVLSILVAVPVQARYNDLRKKFESYVPPAYVQHQFQPARHGKVNVKQPDFGAMEEEKAQMEKIKSGWEQAVTDAKKDILMSGVDQERLEYLRPIAADPLLTAGFIQ